MNLEEAKTLLSSAVKSELRDHAFGDCEVSWHTEAGEIASGYFGGGSREVSIRNGETNSIWIGPVADELRECFSAEKYSRNDETGPDDFEIGRVMPGLTLEGVRKELTGE